MIEMPKMVSQVTSTPWHDAMAQVGKQEEPEWLKEVRVGAFARFEKLGFPGAKDERWKHTPLRFLEKEAFAPAAPTGLDHVSEQDLLAFTFRDEAARLVFVDGHFAPPFSHTRRLPEGVTVGRTFDHLDDPRLRQHLESAAVTDNPMAALNLALARDGAFLRIPKGTTIEAPIHFLFVSTEAEQPVMTHVHNALLVEAHGEASLVESFVGMGRSPTLTNSTTWIAAGLQAHVDHVKVQREPSHATHVAHQVVEQHRDSTVRSMGVSLGAALARQDIEATLLEPGSHCQLEGLFLGAEDQHVDTWTRVDHVAPHCSSHERFKGILADRAHGVFLGSIIVRPGAAGSSSQQENRNLLLSDDAHVDTTPQLEIHNDDVQCSHGSTIGRLDDEALFLLQSRGIGHADARIMLTHAFAHEVLREISDDTIRKALDGLLTRWFQEHAGPQEGS